MTAVLPDTRRLCVHTITTKPWPIETAIDRYAAAGVHGISIWQDAVTGRAPAAVRRQTAEAGLTTVAYVRGGFFPALEAVDRARAVDDNRRMIDEAAEIGAPQLVLVCGAAVGQPLADSRRQIQEGIEALLPYADAAGVDLAIEPLHPMYADTRSAVVTLKQANDLALAIDHPRVGVAIDVYHVWWDDALSEEIRRCGDRNRIQAFHVCDWRSPTRDMLNDRGLMGEGCIPVRAIRQWVDEAGFDGFIEVEIFSETYWSMDQDAFLARIVEAYTAHV